MTREDVQMLLATISATYTNFEVKNKTVAINAWYMFLGDYDVNDVNEALRMYVKTENSAFAPNPGQLIGMIRKPELLSELSAADAWQMVRKAISRGNYYADRDFAQFPDAVQAAVGSPSQIRIWAGDENFNEGVESSNFFARYSAALKKKQDIASMPSAMRERLGLEYNTKNLKELEQKDD